MGCFGKKSKKSCPPSSPKCKPKPTQKAWTQDEWKIHGHYLTQLSVPKKDFALENFYKTPVPRKVPLNQLKPRMNTLAQPKTINTPHACHLPSSKCHCHVADPIRGIHPDAIHYVPTRRIKMLCRPKLDYHEVVRCFPKKNVMCVSKKILLPRSSYRTKKLAMPKYQYLCAPDANPFGVKPEALWAVATDRTLESDRDVIAVWKTSPDLSPSAQVVGSPSKVKYQNFILFPSQLMIVKIDIKIGLILLCFHIFSF
ncbi:uncharacterized protein LOC131682975 [Topomyia yanbarensis]|uniref:uncharacterized protein LOC131682975 n=1 Tax=Topomyia yanbarensis TaxID=2498891 RepID=UPI00273C3AD9|nr:uncharacterized protein LOC131682975 [Topomyia yanbarensis]